MIGAMTTDYLTRLSSFDEKEYRKCAVQMMLQCDDQTAEAISSQPKKRAVEMATEYFLRNRKC